MKTLEHFVIPLALTILTGSSVDAKGGLGMTWKKVGHGTLSALTGGVDSVNCSGCNAYSGDALCTEDLPVLCVKQDGAAIPSGLATGYYNGWVRGNIATTFRVAGTSLSSLATANQLCEASFGNGWRMAEFHDGGGGWGWYGYGNIRSDYRFWVYINDTPGNCWDT